MISFSQLGKQGRLGNQLWQIAATISAAKKYNLTPIFPEWEHKQSFNVPNNYFTTIPIRVTRTYQEPHFHYAPIPNLLNMDLSGYYQSPKYFEGNKEIIDMLTPNYHFDKDPDLCAIHVRRGDYVNIQDCHPLMSMKYYHAAMEKSCYKKFLIFSDDIEWCKKNFTGNMFEFSENNSPPVDLALMSKKCSSNIICNSSFSWWAAYLNNAPNKIVIAPKIWFGAKLGHDLKDLFPESWVKI